MSQEKEQQNQEIQEQIQSELSILNQNFDNSSAGSSNIPVVSVNSEEKQTKKKRGRPKGSKNKNKNNSKIPEVIYSENDRVSPLLTEDYNSNSEYESGFTNSGEPVSESESESESEAGYREEQVYKNFTVNEPLAKSLTKLINIMCMIFKLPELTEQEKDDLVKIWSGVELPVNKSNEKLFLYLPLISAGIFTGGIVLERLFKTVREKNINSSSSSSSSSSNGNFIMLKQ